MNIPVPLTERAGNECDEGTYAGEDGSCLSCYYMCKDCVGGGATQCESCKENAMLFTESGSDTGICKCIDGYKANRITQRCELINN